ncbi:hypothetical protein C8R46DRAFT_1056743 [Mycena filopes]|nr:hypothetical protein C8R46DRAFT_1056743 [Mycena filopes]
MTTTAPGNPHGHILSDKSTELQRDTFIFTAFSCHPITLLLGLNQKLTPISPSKLHRWVDLLSGRHHKFFLCPVRVETLGIMSYSCSPTGPVIEPTSQELLPPGNYAWYSDRNLSIPSGLILPGVELAMIWQSFEYLVLTMEGETVCSLYKFPVGLELAVTKRDAHRCRVSGSNANTVVTWIVPPPWAWATLNTGDPDGFDVTPFTVAANVLTLRADLKVHFYNHNFAVDADDDYRIILFRDMGEAQGLLPTHLPRGPNDDPADAEFFRLHLRYTLNFMLLGGDVSEKYPPHVILHMMEELGVRGWEDCEMAPLTDERWGTELGQAILADELQARMDRSVYESELEMDGPSLESDLQAMMLRQHSPSDGDNRWRLPEPPTQSEGNLWGWVST